MQRVASDVSAGYGTGPIMPEGLQALAQEVLTHINGAICLAERL